MSIESVGSASKDEFEFLKQKDKKYTEDLERIGADLAFVREQVAVWFFPFLRIFSLILLDH